MLKKDRLEIEERNFRDAECLDGHGGRINVIDGNEDAQSKRGTVQTQMALRSQLQAGSTSRNLMSQEGPRRNIFSQDGPRTQRLNMTQGFQPGSS